jgi:hypothetical protein
MDGDAAATLQEGAAQRSVAFMRRARGELLRTTHSDGRRRASKRARAAAMISAGSTTPCVASPSVNSTICGGVQCANSLVQRQPYRRGLA